MERLVLQLGEDFHFQERLGILDLGRKLLKNYVCVFAGVGLGIFADLL